MESLCIRVSRKAGEETRMKLAELRAINKNLKIRIEKEDLLIPVTKEIEGYEIEKSNFEVLEKEPSISELLGFVPAYEQIGDIAIIDRHEPEAQRIAESLLRRNRIKTVLQAETSIMGEYRTREVSILAGERKTETIYRENGCRYMLDLAKVYFTPRLATERRRIADQIKDGDRIVDMFAGVGPFCILIAKKFPAAHVIAIDKNPDAVRYLNENVRLNKVKNAEVREGDARDIAKGISEVDHIIMNLPHSGIEFLDSAFGMIKNGGVIHFYAISHEDDLFEGILEKIKEAACLFRIQIIPLDKRVVRPYAPFQYNICIDFRVVSLMA
ncbi:MAG: class I SAM-dependent methyltransferase family protein [Candidatus Methanoperedens sp.]|nr:class I SAM-dependent methyltransferase family protein [Candidatus Methanoperedens sp.]MCZ7358644.1 class I SAM-dependent methyltransferase family protein [Candidatus Methanoperedens sp.]HLB71913.1 class I SAM-dependent methyltransferase family protein [Candidatus Methanoperedens sp.]